MDTAQEVKKDTRESGTSESESAQGHKQEQQKTPQQLHEEKIAAALVNREQKAKPGDPGKEGKESEGRLIFGKYKSMDDAEKAFNESVSRMNDSQKRLSLLEKSQDVKTAKEVVDDDSDNSIFDETRKELVNKLDVREDVADALIGSMQRIIDHRFKPVQVAMEKSKVLNQIANLQERYEDFDNYAQNINDMLAAYPKDVRKHINLEHLYLAARAQDPNLGKTSEVSKQAEESTIREMQNSSRTSVSSGKAPTGSYDAGEHIWTRNEIAKLAPSEYSKYEKEIMKQVHNGLVK
jgi:hypothetical protein